jgi:hypothetical protein
MIRIFKYKALFLCSLFLFNHSVQAQEPLVSDQLSEQDFLSLVMENHPLIQQAQNLREMGDLAVMAAKGNFDPQLFSKNKQKYYDQKNYYQYSESGISPLPEQELLFKEAMIGPPESF